MKLLVDACDDYMEFCAWRASLDRRRGAAAGCYLSRGGLTAQEGTRRCEAWVCGDV